MSFTILDATGPIMSVKISGELDRSEVSQIQTVALKAIQRWGKISALFALDDCLGWKREGNWGDISFMTQHDQNITKIAVVGEEQWRDLVCAFLAERISCGCRRIFPSRRSGQSACVVVITFGCYWPKVQYKKSKGFDSQFAVYTD